MGRSKGSGNSQEVIVMACLKLVLEKNYGTITISDIEKATNLTRGSLLYHFKDKDQIYFAAVDYFMQQLTDYYERFIVIEKKSLLEFIFAYISNMQSLSRLMKTITNGRQSTYTYFLFQAIDFYPNFKEKYSELNKLERKGWEINIKAAIDRKEIHEDIDIPALITQFQFLYSNVSIQAELLQEKLITHWQASMISLYYNIKIHQEKECLGLRTY